MAFHPTPQSTTTRPSQSSLPLDDFDSAPASTPARTAKTFRPSMPSLPNLPVSIDLSGIKLPSSLWGLAFRAALIGTAFPVLGVPFFSGVGRSILDYAYSAYGEHVVREIQLRVDGVPMTLEVPEGQIFGDDAGYVAMQGNIPLPLGAYEIQVVADSLKTSLILAIGLSSLGFYYKNRATGKNDRELGQKLSDWAIVLMVFSITSAAAVLDLDPSNQFRFDVPFISNEIPTDRVG